MAGDFINFTVVYGFNSVEGMRSLWSDITATGGGVNGPWLLMGNFNVVLSQDERISRAQTSDQAINEFVQCLQQNCLMDVKPRVHISHGGINNRMERLYGVS